MEEQLFNEIRDIFVHGYPKVEKGKMMSSEAITYKSKVFAFFSRQNKMVFKLGKDFDPQKLDASIQVFNPFTKRGPLNGWYEVPFTKNDLWFPMTEKAYKLLKNTL